MEVRVHGHSVSRGMWGLMFIVIVATRDFQTVKYVWNSVVEHVCVVNLCDCVGVWNVCGVCVSEDVGCVGVY